MKTSKAFSIPPAPLGAAGIVPLAISAIFHQEYTNEEREQQTTDESNTGL